MDFSGKMKRRFGKTSLRMKKYLLSTASLMLLIFWPIQAQEVALPIEDYGIIGDLRTAALVGTDGSIDWLCVPRFDSEACFAALLGDEHNGTWRIAPAGRVSTAEESVPVQPVGTDATRLNVVAAHAAVSLLVIVSE